MDSDNKITFFAKTNYRNREVPFGIKTDDRRRHMYVIGKTGMGKTTLMENMVIQDIHNGHGVAFLDPHGDSIQRILNSVPSHRVNDVVYFNPADLEYPLAFNILEAVDPKYKHLVASGLMGVFTKIWANLWSARMEYILNNTILALLDSPGNTLLGITRMYVDKKYRKKIVDNIKDPMVRAFWVDEFANYNEKYRTEAIAPIQNKVGQFLSSAIIRNIVGQPKSTIDLREIMDQKKILVMDLSKGKVGEDNSALLGAMLVTKLQLAAMSRTDIVEHERSDFYLYVDEFQNFATESFATILSEARKYRLNLIVGHQYIAQLEQDKSTKVRDAIFGNVGTMVIFRIGAADAEFMETEFEPTFTPSDLVNLPKYHIILKLMINGVASEPFSAVTLPPNPLHQSGNIDKVIKVSRERYTNSVAEVEDKISRWMGAEFHQESAMQIDSPEQPAGPEEERIQTAAIPPIPETVTRQPEQKQRILDVQPQKMPNNEGAYEPAEMKMSQPKPEVRSANEGRPRPANAFSQKPLQARRDHRDQHKNPRQGHNSFQQGGRSQTNGQKPKQPERKENPIWQTVHELQSQKQNQGSQIARSVVQELLKPVEPKQQSQTPPVPAQPQTPVVPRPPERTVLKPNQPYKV